jgi:hypothetical protein
MAPTRNMVTTPAVSATGTLKRTVSDRIRRLNYVAAPFLTLVKTAEQDKMGDLSYGSGLISKQATDTMKFEWFTLTPLDIYATSTAFSSVTVDMADTSAFRTRDIVTNLTTLEVAIVDTITSATRLTVTAVSATWGTNAVAGDIIAISGRTMEEGTSDITSLTKEPDNNYNYVYPVRDVYSIADTAKNSPHYGGDLLKRYLADKVQACMTGVENSFFLGKRAASGDTTTVSIGGTSYSMFTTRGILDYAGDPFVGAGMTWDRWNTDFHESIPRTINPSSKLKLFCGTKIWGKIQSWAQAKLMQIETGEINEFGIRPRYFYCGVFTVEPVIHNLFNQGALANCAVLIDPDDFVYRFKSDMDFKTVDNLQLPATWGQTRGIQGVVGLQCWSGGANVKLITGWN